MRAARKFHVFLGNDAGTEVFNFIQEGCSKLYSLGKPMRKNDVLLARENAGHRAQVLAEIGRRLRDEYIAEPLPDRLATLVRQIERSGSEGRKISGEAGLRPEPK
jgi:hypothetical protein